MFSPGSESVVSSETVRPMAVSQMIPITRVIRQISLMKIKPHTHETKHEPACHDLPDLVMIEKAYCVYDGKSSICIMKVPAV